MACGGDVQTSVGGIVVGGMMLLVAWCIPGCFGCGCAAARTHAGGAFDSSACRICVLPILLCQQMFRKAGKEHFKCSFLDNGIAVTHKPV